MDDVAIAAMGDHELKGIRLPNVSGQYFSRSRPIF